MSYELRGSYNHSDKGRQLLLFDGLSFGGNVTPTDIDGLIEWHDRKLVLLEIKMKNVNVPRGQKLALQRLVDDSTRCGKDSIAVIADHSVFDSKQDIQVADCTVREIYYGKEHQWRPPKQMMTVDYLVRSFLLL